MLLKPQCRHARIDLRWQPGEAIELSADVDATVRGAHACTVLAWASRTRELFSVPRGKNVRTTKVRFGKIPKPARHRRALPRMTGAAALVGLCCFALAGCESTTNYAPVVTPEMASGKKEKEINLATLNKRTRWFER